MKKNIGYIVGFVLSILFSLGFSFALFNCIQLVEYFDVTYNEVHHRILTYDKYEMSTKSDNYEIYFNEYDKPFYISSITQKKLNKDVLENLKEDVKVLLDNYRSVKEIVNFTNDYCLTIKNRMKSKTIKHVREDKGEVNVIEYKEPFYERDIVDYISKHNNCNKSIAILTETNEQAYVIYSLLIEANITSKLIQNDDSVRLMDLLEIRSFVIRLKNKISTPIISDYDWNTAIREWENEFSNSNILGDLKKYLLRYERINKDKYFSDLVLMLKESKVEDIYNYNHTSVVVSTLHKSKGHEFDEVHVFLNRKSFRYEKDKRALYVGMTRAKNVLFVHTNNNFLKKHSNYCNYIYNEDKFAEIENKIIPLTHKDIYLGDFKNKEKSKLLQGLRAGESLIYNSNVIYTGDGLTKICRLSKDMQEQIRLESEKGYNVVSAYNRFVVIWVDREDIENPKKWLVMLPNLVLSKNSNDKVVLNDAMALRQLLRQCRIKLMKEYDYSKAYLVFDDKTLDELVAKRPTTLSQLSHIKGFGTLKIDKYGNYIVDCINQFLIENKC